MKLYVFTYRSFREDLFRVEEYEVEEKSKCYTCEPLRRRFNKSDIDIPTGYDLHDCILLENNPAKAAEILLPVLEKELANLKKQVEQKENAITKANNLILKERENNDYERQSSKKRCNSLFFYLPVNISLNISEEHML